MATALFRALPMVALLRLSSANPLDAQGLAPDTTVTPRPSWAVYMGAGFGDGFQFIAGGQVHVRTPVRVLSLVPELAIGHGTSLLVGIGAHVAPTSPATRPYVGVSVGYHWVGEGEAHGNTVVVTPKVGLLFDTAAPGLFGEKALGWMLEYQGVDFFALHRVLVGVRWGF